MKKSNFGLLLTKVLQGKGLSQKTFSERLGVTTQSASVWMNGKATPRPATVKKIADALGVPVEALTAYPSASSDVAADVADLKKRVSDLEAVIRVLMKGGVS